MFASSIQPRGGVVCQGGNKEMKAMDYMKQRYEEGGREELQTSARALHNPNKLQRPWGKYACTLCCRLPCLAVLPAVVYDDTWLSCFPWLACCEVTICDWSMHSCMTVAL